ncbi:S-(hydroxymethyl)glutathione dehydrogenase / alcohol dehydrogenase [Pseudonocardia ammonioxydans]|uniref:S-(Hydroxymethyl)glutathione dehydrogenase / alcohol dehydrogenase n=1 Tax=Pseudonocardia ammonioxydans TaxID=260086 RepID=A0A1I5H084_PSUAM|nr:zinc-binding dehydrogenase [Pseudonocardia ammonioxydans]SFO41530.1 S-(hydroxymethyl)glutathione dehydrogenase / alcohol dehydrogenase [Pseudonocardia ammonioxydans]
MVRAAVLRERGGPITVDEIVLPDPGPRQVRVRLAAAGVCHSDLSLANGTLRQKTPAVLGHEGAGVVVAAGAEVTRVSVGEKVVLNWSPSCGTCWFCREGEPYLCEHTDDAAAEPYATLTDGTPIYAALGTGAFAEETVVGERAVVPLPADTDLERVAILGCAVLTGAGAVFHTAGVRKGQSVAVIGLGGIGLCAIQAARIRGAETIIGIDVTSEKGDLALEHGATAFVPAGDEALTAVRELTGGRGADHVFDCVGGSATTRTAWNASRRGGTVTVVGVGAKTSTVEFSALELFWFGRTLHGCVYGSTDPDRDVPELLDLARAGRLDLDALRTATTDLHGIDEAFAALGDGRGARTVIRIASGGGPQ